MWKLIFAALEYVSDEDGNIILNASIKEAP